MSITVPRYREAKERMLLRRHNQIDVYTHESAATLFSIRSTMTPEEKLQKIEEAAHTIYPYLRMYAIRHE